MYCMILLALALIGASSAWDTELTKDVYFTCPTHQALYRIETEHINANPDDRYFSFYCRDFPTFFDHCHWTGFINWKTTSGQFSCGDDSVVAGLHSLYDAKYHDRAWRFFCCGSRSKYRVINPYMLSTMTPINVGSTHEVDDNHWYYGVFCLYDWYHYDRTWQYELASLLKL